MAMAMAPLEFMQSFGNELFFLYYPNVTDWWTVTVAWLWLGGLALAAFVLVLPLAMLMNTCRLHNNVWRMHLFTLIWLPALVQLQAALQTPFLYYYPESYPSHNRVKWYGIVWAVSTPVFWILCQLVCNWGESVLRRLDEMFLSPEKPYTPVSATPQ